MLPSSRSPLETAPQYCAHLTTCTHPGVMHNSPCSPLPAAAPCQDYSSVLTIFTRPGVMLNRLCSPCPCALHECQSLSVVTSIFLSAVWEVRPPWSGGTICQCLISWSSPILCPSLRACIRASERTARNPCARSGVILCPPSLACSKSTLLQRTARDPCCCQLSSLLACLGDLGDLTVIASFRGPLLHAHLPWSMHIWPGVLQARAYLICREAGCQTVTIGNVTWWTCCRSCIDELLASSSALWLTDTLLPWSNAAQSL